MTERNPLVEQARSESTGTGLNLFDDASSVLDEVRYGSWGEAGLGTFGFAADAAGKAFNPIATLASYGLNCLIEYVRPLEDALNWVAGDPAQIETYVATWKNVSQTVSTAANNFEIAVKNKMANWVGPAADAFRAHAQDKIAALHAGAIAADIIGTVVEIAGMVVEAIRQAVRDTATQAVGQIVQNALVLVCSLGLATPVVIAQVSSQVAGWMEKIASLFKKLGSCLGKLRPLMSKLDQIWVRIHNIFREPGAPATTKPRGSDPRFVRISNDNPPACSKASDVTPATQDPIDLTTGRVFLDQTDIDLAGVPPLVLTRSHRSDLRVGRWFGPTWSSTVDQRIEFDGTRAHFLAADGMLLTYPIPVDSPVLPVHGTPWPLSRGDDGGYTITDHRADRFLHFGPNSTTVLPITAISDRNGNRIDFRYDESGVLTEICHSGGYRIAVDTQHGLITALRLLDDTEGLLGGTENGVVLRRYRYDDDRRLTGIVNAADQSTVLSYDRAGRLTSWEDTNGMWYRYIYDASGRCVESRGRDGVLDCTLEFDTESRITRRTNSLGHTTTYHLNEHYQIVREIDAQGDETRSEWDVHHRLLSRTDPLGRTTRYEYDEDGNLIAATRPDGDKTRIEYNDLRLPITFIASDGAISRQDYDERGNITAVTDPLGAVTRYVYNGHGHLRETTDALGHVRHVETDAAGLPTAITDALGATTRYERDGFGRIVTIAEASGGLMRFGWTTDGKPAWRVLSDGATELWTYDGEGNLSSYVDALGHTTATEVTHFDQPAVEIRPDGSRLEFGYDTELRLTTVTNEQGLVWRYEYDQAGNLVRETDFNGRVLSYRHDAAGQLVERINRAGEVTTFKHDPHGNVIERRSGDSIATFTYDQHDRLVEAVNNDSHVHFHRDSLGRVLSETLNGHTVTSRYDALGRRTHRRCPSGAESVWEYNAEDRPVALHTAGRTLRFDYDPAGHETRRALGPNAVLEQAWGANHQLLSQTLTGGSGRRTQHRAYTYRPDGLPTGIHDQLTGPRTFDLDSAGRVTAVNGPQWTERYSYDPSGNITRAHWPTPHSSDDGDQLGNREYNGTLMSRAGNTRYEHDPQGRVVLRQRRRLSRKPDTWRYVWDAEDRLVRARTPDGSLWCYRYDALGRRIAKQRRTPDGRGVLEEIAFAWDGDTLAEQARHQPILSAQPDSRVTVWNYEPGTFRPVSQHDRTQLRHAPQQWIDDEFYAIVTDLAGTPTELVNDTGDIAWFHRTTVWGQTLDQSPTSAYTPLRFPGQYHDPETGFNYNYHRYYDPTTGRYGSSDPLGLRGGLNPHTYVSNPHGWIDPLGLSPCSPEPQGPHLALGLRRTLRDFAKEQNAITYQNELFSDIFRQRAPFRNLLRSMIDRAVERDGRISFNLEGMKDIPGVIRGESYVGKFTSWELRYVYNNPAAWARTTFYNGVVP